MAIAAPFPSVRTQHPVRAQRPSRSRSVAARPAPLRLTRRGRVVLGLVSAAVAFVALAATGPQADAADVTSGGPATATIVVQPGDSVWSIAKSLDPAADPRALMARIRDLNALSDGVVVAGQALIVPRVGD